MRLSGLGWVLIGALVGMVAVYPLSEAASLALGLLAALIGVAAVSEAVGSWSGPRRDLARRDALEDKRAALRNLSSGRDWDRKAPDFPDEPQDAIFARERKRRGLG